MNHQSTNSSVTTQPSAPVNASALVTSDKAASALAEAPQTKTKHKPQSTAKASVSTKLAPQNDARCRHFTCTGRRCRLAPLDPVSGLCFRHIGRQFQPSDEDLSPSFAGLLSGFDSPSRIHDFLTQVTVLLVQNRISTRRAAVLTYLGQTLLRTIPAIELELHPENEQIIFDLPRPKRD